MRNNPKPIGSCGYPDCNEKAYSIIRRKIVCFKHFKMIQMDNKRRMKAGMAIPKDFSFLDETKNYYRYELKIKPIDVDEMLNDVSTRLKGGMLK